MGAKLDPRLTEWSYEERHAGPTERMCDTHIHWDGDPKNLKMLSAAREANNIEYMFMIAGRNADQHEWIKAVDAEFGIGKHAIPYFMLDLNSNDPAQVNRAYDLGFWGLKWIGTQIPLDDRWYDPLLKRANDLNMANLYHVGVLAGGRTGSGMSLQRADMLDTVSKRYPDMLIQGGHLGEPNINEAFWACEFGDNLIWDCSGGCRFQCDADPTILYAAMHRRKSAWDVITFASDCSQGIYPPEWADGWKSKIDHRMCEWHDILSRLPETPTTEQLDAMFHGNAARWVARIKEQRGVE
ncbi:amidohydrolase family protein [Planctomycetota bacterium]